MDMDAAALIADLMGKSMRMIANKQAQHFEGGSQAARVLRRQRKLSTKTARRLHNLSIAFAITRHIDAVSCEEFIRVLSSELGGASYAVTNEVPDKDSLIAGVDTHGTPVQKSFSIAVGTECEAPMCVDAVEPAPEQQAGCLQVATDWLASLPRGHSGVNAATFRVAFAGGLQLH